MNHETKLRIFLDHHLKNDVLEAIEDCFLCDADPEASWFVFRKTLKTIKKKHVELYGNYLETDDNSEIEESEITKHRNKI